MLTNKWTEKSGKEKKIRKKLFSIVQGWFLVLSTNECHIDFRGHTVMGWHFFRDYLHFKFESESCFEDLDWITQ